MARPSSEYTDILKIRTLKEELQEGARAVLNGKARVGHKLVRILPENVQGINWNALGKISVGEFTRCQLDMLREMVGLGKPRIHRAYRPDRH